MSASVARFLPSPNAECNISPLPIQLNDRNLRARRRPLARLIFHQVAFASIASVRPISRSSAPRRKRGSQFLFYDARRRNYLPSSRSALRRRSVKLFWCGSERTRPNYRLDVGVWSESRCRGITPRAVWQRGRSDGFE